MKKTSIIAAAFTTSLVTTLTMVSFGKDDGHTPEKAEHHASSSATPDVVEVVGHDVKEEPHTDEVTLTAAAVAQNGIKVGTVESRALAASFLAPSRIAFDAESTAHVGSVVSGRVIDINTRVGDVVKKDDVLLTIESPELGQAQSDFLQRRTEMEIADAAIAPSTDAYTRAKQLFEESQGIAYSEVQKREVEQRMATGNARSARAAFQAAESRLRLFGLTQDDVKRLTDTGEIRPRFNIRAPLGGQVVEREVTLGELVSPDKEKLLVISDTSTVWVLADVPEARLVDIGVGSKAEVELVAMPNVRITGEVSLVSAEVDPNSRTARLRIVVANNHGKLRPGMFARSLIHAVSANAPAVLAVPEEAVQTVEGKPAVFVPVEGEANTFARREITHGRAVNGYVPVLSGLKIGEQVVVSGSFILKAELGKSEAGHEH